VLIVTHARTGDRVGRDGRQTVDGVDPYEALALELPNDVRIGSALITMVEPHPGAERAYNRWYEDDHFYSGAMHGPWVFSGRRWVAPRALRDRRVAVANPAVEPPDAGCYISLYWSTAGHELDVERWSYLAMDRALIPHGRGFTERTHVYTAFHRPRLAVTRDATMQPHVVLDHPFTGLVVEILDAPPLDGPTTDGPDTPERVALTRWLEQDEARTTLAEVGAGACLAFAPQPFAGGRIDRPGTPPVAPPAGVGRRLCVLWFLADGRHDDHPGSFAAHHDRIAASGLGEVRFSGAFVPTIPGTDRYVDELR
jgi:hypothetical protein